MTLEVANSGLTWQAFPVAGVLEAAGPSLDLNYLLGTLGTTTTFSRASTATDGLSTDAAGSGFNTFAINAPRLSASTGLLIEAARTNLLKNSGTPATQTTGSLATGAYALWVIGTGSATSSAGTSTGSGFGAATAGSPNVFTLTGGGTVTVTVSGSLTRYQLEAGGFASSYIPTTAATVTRQKDIVTSPLPIWFNPAAGTLSVEVMLPQTSVSTNQYLAEIGDLTNNNRFLLNCLANSSFVTVTYAAAAVELANYTTTGLITPGTPFKAAFSVGAAGSSNKIAVNGVNVTQASSGGFLPLPLATIFGIGQRATVIQQQFGYTRRIRYWPRALSLSELQAVTT